MAILVKFLTRDHPRVCGEELVLRIRMTRRRGSPPRVRGGVWASIMSSVVHGITPACAGRRLWRSGLRRFARDHPRVCGEE